MSGRRLVPHEMLRQKGTLDSARPPSPFGPASGLGVEVHAVLRRTHSGISSRLGV